MSFPGGGHNPAFGRDPGTTRTVEQHVYYGIPGVLPHFPTMVYYYPGYYPAPPYTAPYAARPPLGAAYGIDETGQFYHYISGFNDSGRYPQPAPVIDPDFPAANLINGTGGAGAEPGFNYFFPTQHAKVHVLKCAEPPWRLAPGTVPPYYKTYIPANVTVAELMMGFGAQNPDKAKNQLWEVYEQGGGCWGWKEHVTGDDEIMMARTVRDMGWCEKRNGHLPTTFLWFSKS
ncbi:hypothetical protein C8A03DRAFT_17416 [Achaetomium macrosporum]|uniref:Uncharacterized protein n=1 Tax=Achaetomium macrosporum TaxID=79813 RepID=A0AAN7C5P4_9PEZI|nr:hypothetical protein C8A03DRAFT_17416 [Achaetomium macrosporum]